jgi:hypothetical protein
MVLYLFNIQANQFSIILTFKAVFLLAFLGAKITLSAFFSMMSQDPQVPQIEISIY